MTIFFIALLTALGGGVWIYTKAMKYTGGITKNALIVAAMGAFLLFLIVWSVLGALD